MPSPTAKRLSLGLLVATLASPVAAQTAAPPAAATDQVVPEKDRSRPQDSTTPASAPTLSEKLTQTNGVIPAPTNVDPGMAKAAPNAGVAVTPVIPPAGSPGGNPAVQPK